MYKRRVIVFLALVGAAFLVIVVRLCQLQLAGGEEFRREITRRVGQDDVLPAGRGHILDRNGALLAVDEPCFDLCVDYRLLFAWGEADSLDPARRAFRKKVAWWERQQRRVILAGMVPDGDRDANRAASDLAAEVYHRRLANTWRVLRDLAGSDAKLTETVRGIVGRVEHLRDASRHKNPREQLMAHAVVRGLDEAAAVAVKGQLDELVGVSVRPSFKRTYPYGRLACHVIGFLGQVSAADQIAAKQDDEGDSYRSGDIIGKSGVEKMCERELRGRRGARRLHRMTGAVLSETPADNGQDVHLTLDIALQNTLARLFPAGANGCIVVLSVPTGEVLAMVSLPAFDLNTYAADYLELVKNDLDFPLRHRAVSQVYPPGSTAKPLAALAALGSAAITLETTFTCTGYFDPADPNKLRCWTVARGMPGHGPVNVVDGLKHSCNVFFYHTGEAAGGRTLAEWFGMFGFTAAPGLGLPEERSGIVAGNPSPAESRLMAIGQGPVAVTPLHVANAMAAIASDGVFCAPTVIVESPARPQRRLPVDASCVAAVKLGMHKVVDEPDGTAYRAFHGEGVAPLGIEVCGKTGTATVSPLTASSGRQHQGDMAWFAGFAPYRDPQIAFAVVVEYVEGGGAANAGPVARETLRACIERGYLRGGAQ